MALATTARLSLPAVNLGTGTPATTSGSPAYADIVARGRLVARWWSGLLPELLKRAATALLLLLVAGPVRIERVTPQFFGDLGAAMRVVGHWQLVTARRIGR